MLFKTILMDKTDVHVITTKVSEQVTLTVN